MVGGRNCEADPIPCPDWPMPRGTECPPPTSERLSPVVGRNQWNSRLMLYPFAFLLAASLALLKSVTNQSFRVGSALTCSCFLKASHISCSEETTWSSIGSGV